MKTLTLVRALLIASFLVTSPIVAVAQDKEQVITYKYKMHDGDTEEVDAMLRLPTSNPNKKAVVLLHDGGGWGTAATKQYAEVLTSNGYVTLEPRLWSTSAGTAFHKSIPKVFGALTLLAKRADVDPKSIYVMGQSAGAMLAIMVASGHWAEKPINDSGTKFKAHAAIYPVCWVFIVDPQADDPRTKFFRNTETKWTGAPVRMFIGTKDDYDDRDVNTCSKFVAQIPDESAHKNFSVVIYEGATHGWDQFGATFESKDACKGRGCTNTNHADAAITKKSIQDVLTFFNMN